MRLRVTRFKSGAEGWSAARPCCQPRPARGCARLHTLHSGACARYALRACECGAQRVMVRSSNRAWCVPFVEPGLSGELSESQHCSLRCPSQNANPNAFRQHACLVHHPLAGKHELEALLDLAGVGGGGLPSDLRCQRIWLLSACWAEQLGSSAGASLQNSGRSRGATGFDRRVLGLRRGIGRHAERATAG